MHDVGAAGTGAGVVDRRGAGVEQFGPYVLQELIGRGGMGEVFRAWDTVRARTVALKRLPVSLAHDEAFRTRFRTESEVAARLNDPHVLPIHDFGSIDDRLFIDMRYVDGADLAGLLTRVGTLGALDAVEVLAQVASALDAAHGQELIHRDVKPSNVLLTLGEDGDTPRFAYLTDFGVAQIGGADTGLSTTNTTAGTLDYMAPERFGGRRVTHRVDVYSLGCVLYEMLTGDKPFPAQSMPESMHAHIYLDPPRPSDLRPELPEGLDEVVARAMAKAPDERYDSCGALAADARDRVRGSRAARAPGRLPATLGGDAARPEQRSTPPRPDKVLAGARPAAQWTPVPRVPPRKRRPAAVAVTACLAAVAILAGVMVVGYLAAPGESSVTQNRAAVAPAPAAVGSASAAPVTPVAEPSVAPGTYAGRTSGNQMTVAIATKDGKVAAYLCDGKSVEAWMQGTLDGRDIRLRSPKGATLTATIRDNAAFGTISAGGQQNLSFSADLAAAPAGLYEARSGSTRIGWIVLSDGSRVGLSQTNGVSTPAPALDTATGTTTVNGSRVPATPVTGA